MKFSHKITKSFLRNSLNLKFLYIAKFSQIRILCVAKLS